MLVLAWHLSDQIYEGFFVMWQTYAQLNLVCQHTWRILKEENSIRLETLSVNRQRYCFNKENNEKRNEEERAREGWCYQECNKRAIRLCSQDTEEREGALPITIKKRDLQWENLADRSSGQCRLSLDGHS